MKPQTMNSGTCLAVLKDDEGYLYFASDRRGSWGFGKAHKLEDPKSRFRSGVLMMGTGGCFEIVEMLDHMKIAPFTPKTNPDMYMHNKFIPAIVRHFKTQGLLHPKERRLRHHDDSEWIGAVMVVGLGSSVYEVTVDNLHIVFNKVGAPWAHGCGGALAWGSLLTTEALTTTPDKLEMSIPDRLVFALSAAATVSPGCDDNIDIISNKPGFDPMYIGV